MKCDCWKVSYLPTDDCSCGRYSSFEQKQSAYDKAKKRNYLHSMRLSGMITRTEINERLQQEDKTMT